MENSYNKIPISYEKITGNPFLKRFDQIKYKIKQYFSYKEEFQSGVPNNIHFLQKKIKEYEQNGYPDNFKLNLVSRYIEKNIVHLPQDTALVELDNLVQNNILILLNMKNVDYLINDRSMPIISIDNNDNSLIYNIYDQYGNRIRTKCNTYDRIIKPHSSILKETIQTNQTTTLNHYKLQINNDGIWKESNIISSGNTNNQIPIFNNDELEFLFHHDANTNEFSHQIKLPLDIPKDGFFSVCDVTDQYIITITSKQSMNYYEIKKDNDTPYSVIKLNEMTQEISSKQENSDIPKDINSLKTAINELQENQMAVLELLSQYIKHNLYDLNDINLIKKEMKKLITLGVIDIEVDVTMSFTYLLKIGNDRKDLCFIYNNHFIFQCFNKEGSLIGTRKWDHQDFKQFQPEGDNILYNSIQNVDKSFVILYEGNQIDENNQPQGSILGYGNTDNVIEDFSSQTSIEKIAIFDTGRFKWFNLTEEMKKTLNKNDLITDEYYLKLENYKLYIFKIPTKPTDIELLMKKTSHPKDIIHDVLSIYIKLHISTLFKDHIPPILNILINKNILTQTSKNYYFNNKKICYFDSGVLNIETQVPYTHVKDLQNSA